MRTAKIFKLTSIAMLAVGLVACNKPGPAKTAGKKIDQAFESAGEKISAATESASEKLGTQAAQTGANLGGSMDDAEITARIKATIFAEPGLKTLQISVDTVNGVVTLSGSVDSQSKSDMAKALAAAVEGVTKVENRLELKPVAR
ncbi:MAG TPA: BON domain-containing protein [Gallionella sp.]|nr:BON domain-containing protein [Gallionella sp.]